MPSSRVSRTTLRALRSGTFVVWSALVLVALPASFEIREAEVPSASEVRKDLFDIDLELTLFARVPRPTAMAVRYGDDAIYVASKKGQVWQVLGRKKKVVLDVEKELSFGFEQGLLGLAFTPDGNRLVVNFTNKKDASVTRIYDFDGEAIDSSKKDLFVVPKPKAEHNAGNLAFGPDGYLYLSLGDGGLSGDPDDNAQSLDEMLGKIHRIEILPGGFYGIPDDNPFADRKGARGEIWAYGFRNPWRYSFDRLTGDLWIADVGRDNREEIDFEPFESPGGNNYGWNKVEGSIPYEDRKPPKDHVLPVYDYQHDDETCAATGGFVYRGSAIAGLDGTYLFSDFCRGGLDAIRLKDGEVDEYRRYADIEQGRISSFGQDADGELYVLALEDGAVYRIDPA